MEDSIESPEGTPKTIEEALNRMCAYYMSIGCSFEQFWYGDVSDLAMFVDADEYRQMRNNADMYLQGLYVYNAVSAVAGEVMYAVNDKKGQKPKGYLQRPIPITELEHKYDLERRKQETRKWFMKGQGNG